MSDSPSSNRTVRCPKCSVKLTIAAATVAERVKCPKCQTVMRVGNAARTTSKAQATPSQHSAEGVASTSSSAKLRSDRVFSRPWQNPMRHAGGWVVAFILVSFLVVPIVSAVRFPKTDGIVFACIATPLAAFCLYRLLIPVANVTKYSIQHDQLRFQHGPMPWFPKKPVSVAGAVGVASVEQFLHSSSNKGASKTFHIAIQLADGGRRFAVKMLPSRAVAESLSRFMATAMNVPFLGWQADADSIAPMQKSLVIDSLYDDHAAADQPLGTTGTGNPTPIPVASSGEEARWTIQQHGDLLTAVKRWYSPVSGFLLSGGGLFAIIGITIMLIFKRIDDAAAYLPIAVGMMTLVAGIYYGIALLINRTVIDWTPRVLT